LNKKSKKMQKEEKISATETTLLNQAPSPTSSKNFEYQTFSGHPETKNLT
jgi:hypothetical protein